MHVTISSPISRFLLLIAFGSIAPSLAIAQALPVGQAVNQDASTGSANNMGPSGIVPVRQGYNFSLVSSSEHDSGGGWSSILTPDLAFRFSRHLSVDFAAPTYAYFIASINTGTVAAPIYATEPRYFAMGDSTLAGHLNFGGDSLAYSFAGAIGMPTGNDTYGLTAGQVTYNLNNHFDTSFGILSPDVEIGLSDSSSLINQRLTRGRSFMTTGKLAHFQVGGSIDLPRHCSFEAEAYEELPLGSQQVFGSTKGRSGVIGRGRGNQGNAGRGQNGQGNSQASTTVSTSSGLAEDNGLYTSLDIPLNPHLVASAVYGYSLRQQDSTAGFSFTYLLRARPTPVR